MILNDSKKDLFKNNKKIDIKDKKQKDKKEQKDIKVVKEKKVEKKVIDEKIVENKKIIKKESIKKIEIKKEPEIKTIINRFGRIDHRMRINIVEIKPISWKEEIKQEKPIEEEIKNLKKIKIPDVNENLVNRLMEKYSIKDDKQPKKPEIKKENKKTIIKETKTEKKKNIPKIDDLKNKLELMKERLNENRIKLKKEIEEEAQKNESLNKVKNIDKYVKLGIKKREKRENNNKYGYPVYKPKTPEQLIREEREKKFKEKSIEKNDIEEEEIEKEIKEDIVEIKKEIIKDEPKVLNKDEDDIDDFKALCRNIIKEKIEEEKEQELKKESVQDESSKDEEEIVPIKKNLKNKSISAKSKSRSKPKRKLGSKKNIKPTKGGYLSKYSSKIGENINNSTKRKMPRFSSKARKRRNSELDNYASTRNEDITHRNKKKIPKKPSNFIRGIFSKDGKKSKKTKKNLMKDFGTKTLESIASLNKTLEQSKDFSNTIGFHSSQIKDSIHFEELYESKKKRKKKRKRSKSVKKQTKKEKRKSKRKSVDSKRSRRFNNTSLEEVERTPPKIKLEKKDYNIPSRSQAPKKLSIYGDGSSSGSRFLTGRELSLGPSMNGNFQRKNINKKSLRPLIKKESLSRMSSSISKTRMFPQSKSKQQLLSNLEKLKKFKPLIKQSIDVFEKPRMSLNKKKFEVPEIRLPKKSSLEDNLENDVITEEGASNYNTRNSYDDFLEYEKKIRKSVQIDNLKGLVTKKESKQKKKSNYILDEDKYVDEIVELAIGGKSQIKKGPIKSKKTKKNKRKPKKKVARKTKREIISEADNLAVDLEANLLRLKEEMKQDSSESNEESVPISSMKGGYFNENKEYQYGRQSSRKSQIRVEKIKGNFDKSKALSKTLDIKATKIITTMNRKVEKQESLRDIISNNKMSLQWKKDRIKEYGRVKKKPKKKDNTEDKSSRGENKKKMEIKKINSKFGKDQKMQRTPKQKKTITGQYDSCIVKVKDKNSRNTSYDWLIENPNRESITEQRTPQSKGRFGFDDQHQEIKKQFKLATGEQNVTLRKLKKDKEKKDKHFSNLIRKNTNQGETRKSDEYVSETNQRIRRKRKTDLKKRLDLDRLKNLNSKMQKRNSAFNTENNFRTELFDEHVHESEIRKKTNSEGGINLTKGMHSKLGLRSGKSKNYGRDFSIEIKVPGERPTWISEEDNFSPKIISELGSGSDIMVKNRLIEDRNKSRNKEIKAIPEFEEMPLKVKGDSKKAQYRRDRMKEYGQKLKVLGSQDRKKRTKVDAQEFLNNL